MTLRRVPNDLSACYYCARTDRRIRRRRRRKKDIKLKDVLLCEIVSYDVIAIVIIVVVITLVCTFIFVSQGRIRIYKKKKPRI